MENVVKDPQFTPKCSPDAGLGVVGGVNWGDFYGLQIWSPESTPLGTTTNPPPPFSLELQFGASHGDLWYCGEFALCRKDIVSLNSYYGRTREMASWAITVANKKKLGYPSQD